VRAASPALLALLSSGVDFHTADLWTLTLQSGVVVRWSGADIPLSFGGETYSLGPIIARTAISEKLGLEVSTMTVTLTARARGMSGTSPSDVGGMSLIPLILALGLDGATVRLDRAFLAAWDLPVVGIVASRFAGRVTSVPRVAGASADLVVSSWTILLNVETPPNIYKATCKHTLYDSGCTLSAVAHSSTGHVLAGVAGPPDTRPNNGVWLSSITGLGGLFTLGRIVFTSGANAGITRSVMSNDADGTFQITNPLPQPPTAGDSFTAYWGCDRTSATCSGRFSNLEHFLGTEFVPVPETIL